MNVLIVHAHYEPRSFTCAMKDQAVETLRDQRHQVEVLDLREMNFDPVAKKSDFLAPKREDYTVYSLEQRHGWSTHTIAADIAAEVEKLLRADLLILNFPVFWFSVPAIMKGWIDRVFLSGVCFGGREFYDRGRLVGKRALVCATIGGREYMFGPNGVHGPIETMLQHLLRGTLGYVGMDVLPPYMAWHVPYIDEPDRRRILEHYRGHLQHLDSVQPLAMPSLSDYDSVMRPLRCKPAESI
jgi:NAD(P)H dehydrogenase (quinone)